jgi:hypothetical protein
VGVAVGVQSALATLMHSTLSILEHLHCDSVVHVVLALPLASWLIRPMLLSGMYTLPLKRHMERMEEDKVWCREHSGQHLKYYRVQS